MHRAVPVMALAATAALAATSDLVAPALADAHSAATTYSLDYAGTGLAGVGPLPYLYGYGHAQGTDVAGVALPAPRDARRVTVSVADRTGRSVLADVEAEARDGAVQHLGQVCGARRTFRLPTPGSTVHVYLLAGQCGSDVSAPTTGTVTLTLLRR